MLIYHPESDSFFWDEYFEVTGARLEDVNYMLRPVTLPEYPCG